MLGEVLDRLRARVVRARGVARARRAPRGRPARARHATSRSGRHDRPAARRHPLVADREDHAASYAPRPNAAARRDGWAGRCAHPARLRPALLACVACLVGCDHATKLAAETSLRGPRPRSPSSRACMDLALHGEPQRRVQRARAPLAASAGVAARRASRSSRRRSSLALWVRRRRGQPWRSTPASRSSSREPSATRVDRAARGHVVDFIHVHFWPVFNVADVLVVAGGCCCSSCERGDPGPWHEGLARAALSHCPHPSPRPP